MGGVLFITHVEFHIAQNFTVNKSTTVSLCFVEFGQFTRAKKFSKGCTSVKHAYDYKWVVHRVIIV